jgi:hypothetical protein
LWFPSCAFVSFVVKAVKIEPLPHHTPLHLARFCRIMVGFAV